MKQFLNTYFNKEFDIVSYGIALFLGLVMIYFVAPTRSIFLGIEFVFFGTVIIITLDAIGYYLTNYRKGEING